MERNGKYCVFNRNLAFLCAVFLLQAVVEEECMPADQFVEHLLPSLLSLASDPVPNVRVLLAKALRQTLLEKGAGSSFLRENRSRANALFLLARLLIIGSAAERLFGSVYTESRVITCKLGCRV